MNEISIKLEPEDLGEHCKKLPASPWTSPTQGRPLNWLCRSPRKSTESLWWWPRCRRWTPCGPHPERHRETKATHNRWSVTFSWPRVKPWWGRSYFVGHCCPRRWRTSTTFQKSVSAVPEFETEPKEMDRQLSEQLSFTAFQKKGGRWNIELLNYPTIELINHWTS